MDDWQNAQVRMWAFDQAYRHGESLGLNLTAVNRNAASLAAWASGWKEVGNDSEMPQPNEVS